MAKIDLKKELKHLYRASAKTPTIVNVPPMNFIMIDGSGDPNTAPEFQEALEALIPLAYTLKFKLKKGDAGVDFAVMPLEGLWWVEGMEGFSPDDKSNWKWTLMMMQPEWVTADMFAQAVEEVKGKKNPLALPRVRFGPYHDGLSAQIMHIGPYSEEGPTVAKLHAFIEESGHKPRGKHREIYLGNPQRTAPEKLRTIIRQPIT